MTFTRTHQRPSAAPAMYLCLLTIFACCAVSSALHCPGHCTCVTQDTEGGGGGGGGGGEIVNCSGKRFVTLPATPKSTVTLDLSRNQLGPWMNTSFTQHMFRLAELDLSHNGLKRLLGCTLTGMLGLKVLRLRANQLEDIPASLLDDNEKLEILDLSDNLLTSLEFDFLRPAVNLRSLDVSRNRFTALTLGARFKVPRNLEFLDLSFNNFRHIGEDAFQEASNWHNQVSRTVNLKQCGLEIIHENSLKKIPSLRVLDLSSNPNVSVANWTEVVKSLPGLEQLSMADCALSQLDSIFSPGSESLSLKTLNISHNAISSLPLNTFQAQFSLRVLDMSHNLMTTLTPGFKRLKNLRTLNISHNSLADFQGVIVTKMPKLHTLWLSNNQLSAGDSVDISSLPIRELVLHNNQLTLTPLPANTSNVEVLDLHSNALAELPVLESARNLQYIDYSNNSLSTLQSHLFKDAYLIKVAKFSHNQITSINDNAFLPHSPLVLDLSHNAITDLNTPHWVATQQLNLASNQLYSLSPGTFYDMKSLLKLDISRNKLVFLKENLFDNLGGLKELDLSHNQLGGTLKNGAQEIIMWTSVLSKFGEMSTLNLGYNNISSLPSDALNQMEQLETLYLDHNKLTTIYPLIFRDRSDMKALDLSGNPFHCSCDLLAFRDWLSRTHITVLGIQVVGAKSAYNCSTPESRRHLHVKGWRPDEFECNQSTFYLIVFGSLAVFLVIAVVAGIGLLRLCRQWRAKRKEKRRRRARILRELEEVQKGKYGKGQEEDLVLVSREIAAEIESALERKKKLERKDRDTKQHRGGYIPWPLRGRKGYTQVEEPMKPEEEPVKTISWGDGLDRRDIRDEERRGEHSSGRSPGHVGKSSREREVPRIVRLDQHYPYVVREAVPVAEKVQWLPRPRYQEDRYRYQPRQGQPYYVPYNRDSIEPVGQPTVWTTGTDHRPTKYWTLPSRSSREEVRYVDDLKVHHPLATSRAAGVRFEDPRYYNEPRPGSYEYWRRYHGNRSLSQSYLAAEPRGEDPRERDRAQRQYESIEHHQRGRDGLGPRSSSQPTLAHPHTSGWL